EPFGISMVTSNSTGGSSMINTYDW
ncbi:hypothetical protein GA0115255_124452, partial [Streptomyces sp. Ncost-T6T-2b]